VQLNCTFWLTAIVVACGYSYFAYSFEPNRKSVIEIMDSICNILFFDCCCLNCRSAECGDTRELNKKSFDKLMNSVSNLCINYLYLYFRTSGSVILATGAL